MSNLIEDMARAARELEIDEEAQDQEISGINKLLNAAQATAVPQMGNRFHDPARFNSDDAEACFNGFLECMGFDTKNDPHMRGTAKRVVKMFRQEVFVGLFDPPPAITTFATEDDDTHELYDQMIYSGSITVRSMCSHHMLPISGTAHVGILLNDESPLPGLSKYARIVHHFAARPQTQERLTQQIAHHLDSSLKPKGVGVLIRAQHFCQCHRGVREPYSPMITHGLRGVFKTAPAVKDEFLQLIALDQSHANRG